MLQQRLTWQLRLGLLLVPGLMVVACSLPGSTPATPAAQTITAQRGTVETTINATGTVKALADLALSPAGSGVITQIQVKVGDRVTAGQPLVHLDTRDLELTLRQAEANLASAQAKYETAAMGATDKEITQAQSAVESAQAKLRQTLTGTTTAQDVANAEAALRSAEAKLAATRAGTTTEADLANAEAALRSAEAKLTDLQAAPTIAESDAKAQSLAQAKENRAKQASQLSLAKENARLAMEQGAAALRSAQAKYGASKLIYDEAVRTNKDPNVACSSGQTCNNKLTETKLRSYKADFEQAEQAMVQAEQTLEQRRLAYEDARTQEVVGLQVADSQIAAAQTALETVMAGATALELTQAQAAVDQARANLAKLTQPVKATDITQAQAAVDQARSNLAKLQRPVDPNDVAQVQATVASAQASLADLQSGPKAADLATALAGIKQAEAALDAQRLKLAQATLTAPFAGVVAAVNAIPGQQVTGAASLLTLVDDSLLTVDVSVAESDIAKVKLEQPARVTFSALPNQVITGTVMAVAPKATVQSNVVTYPVTVALDKIATGVRTGMTATVAIITAQKADVMLVPNRAVQTQAQHKVVTIQAQGQTTTVPVQLGLVGDSRTEVVSGVKEGDVIMIPSTTTATRTTQPSGGFGIPGAGAPPPKP